MAIFAVWPSFLDDGARSCRGIAKNSGGCTRREWLLHRDSRYYSPLERAIPSYRRNGFHPTCEVTDFFGMPLYEYAMTILFD